MAPADDGHAAARGRLAVADQMEIRSSGVRSR